jgi:cobalt-zinc-cadmium efflux system membrane fusion protein
MTQLLPEKVSYVGNLLGEQTRAAKARVVIANPNMAWRPGLFVNAAMKRGEKSSCRRRC